MDTYTGDRPDLLRFVERGRITALDVGCGGGGFAPLLRSRGVRQVVGIEPDAERAALASTVADRVLCSTIEQALDDGLDDSQFDLIVVSDVLEHLVDPWSVTERLATHLGAGGQMLLSVPNVGNLEVVKQLVRRGDWRYDDSGMFDRTHLRWFGRSTLRALLDRAGLAPQRWGARLSIGIGPLHTTRLVDDVGRIPSIAIYQHHILARRA